MILVVGSINMDVCLKVPSIPAPGETVLSGHVMKSPGGKGANQAVAAAKLGADVTMLGCVGSDENGEALLVSLKNAGVYTEKILRAADTPTSTAYICVAESGENCIVVDPTANMLVTPSYVLSHEELFREAEYCVLQMEIPPDTVRAVKGLCRQYQVKVVFNPSPMSPAAKSLLEDTYCLIPNETEAAELLGRPFEETSEEDWQAFLRRYNISKLVITLGKEGCRLYEAGKDSVFCAARRVTAVDTTGAGDTFLGAFVAADSERRSAEETLRFANTASGIEVTRPGAQCAMPTRAEVEAALSKY